MHCFRRRALMGGMMCLKHLSGARCDMLFKPGCDGKMHTGLLRDRSGTLCVPKHSMSVIVADAEVKGCPFDEANLRN